MNVIVPLWADGDWIKLIVPAVMFSVYILNLLLGGKSPAAKQAKARQQVRVNPPPQAPAEKLRVEDEVGEFLRRAAQQRAGNKENRPAPASPQAKPPKPVRRQLTDATVARQTTAPPAAAAESRPRTLATSITESYAQRNQPNRTAASQDADQAVASMQSHVAQTFDHGIGTMSTPAPGGDQAPAVLQSSTANELVAMLRDPQSIREAIVISEVLRRPVERW